MNESYRLGEQSIIAYLQRLANGISTAELDVAALPAELRAVGEQLQKTHAILQQERRLLESNAYIDPLTNLGNRNGFDRQPVSILNELKALLEEAPQVPGTKLVLAPGDFSR